MADLIVDLHGRLLRGLAKQMGQHFEGLGVAARAAQRRGLLDKRLAKKLRRVDDAFNVLRHITEPSAAALVAAVDERFAIFLPQKNDGLNEKVPDDNVNEGGFDVDEEDRFVTGLNENLPDAENIADNMVGLEGLNEDCSGDIKVHDLRSGLGDERLEQNTDATSGLHPPGLVGLPENFVQNTKREARFIWPDYIR